MSCGRARGLPLAGALTCAACLVALISYAATHISAQLGVLGGLLAGAAGGEAVIRLRGRSAVRPAEPGSRGGPPAGPGNGGRPG